MTATRYGIRAFLGTTFLIAISAGVLRLLDYETTGSNFSDAAIFGVACAGFFISIARMPWNA
jgi:hypothetical protein